MAIYHDIRNRLSKMASSRMRDRVRRTKIDRRRQPGAPPGADPDVLADVSRRLLGAPPRSFQHASVSGYKEATAFIFWMTDAAGKTRRAFFKDVNLAPERYPAIVGFPGRPGLPEADLFKTPTNDLSAFLPPVYAHAEIEPDVHYQYFLADLNATHRWGFRQDDLLDAFDRMLEVSAAISGWMDEHPDNRLIRYDGEFPSRFVEYARDALGRFHERTGDPRTARLLGRWDEVASLYLSETPETADDAVHGDFRRDNMFHDRRDPTRIAVVDWEYGGMGWIHNDLVSLLKMAGHETVTAALGRLALARPHRSAEEHWRLYQRCRLERGLLDAALVANQRLARSDEPTLSNVHFERVNDAVGLLLGTPAAPIS
jgi:hypothetical protein